VYFLHLALERNNNVIRTKTWYRQWH